MRAVDTEAPATCGAFQLQPVLLDSTENGKFRAGNQPLSDTDAGVEMFAGQTFGMASVINNISLQHIWVRCEKDSQLLNVTVVVL